MKVNKNIRVVIGLVLTVTFLLPSIVQLTHLSDKHEHSVCFEQSDHVHDISYDCSIQDFQITPFDFNSLQDSNTSDHNSIYSVVLHYYYITNKSYYFTTNSLRAPPHLS